MQIYAVSHGMSPAARTSLADAVASAAVAVPALRDGARTSARSASGRLEVEAVSHGAAAAGRRRYCARGGDHLLLFDGLPVARDGSFAAHDATVLLQRWDQLAETVTGQFSAVRVDLAGDAVDVVNDVVGLAQVFVYRRGEGWVLSNSVEVIRVYLALTEPDPLGVASLLAIGWAMGGRTLLAGVESLPFGHVHRLNGTGRVTASDYLAPATLARRRLQSAPAEASAELAERLRRQTIAVADAGPLECGLTAGRDSRVLMALAEAAGVEADYYTIGPDGSEDVRVAQALSRAVGARHRRVAPVLPPNADAWLSDTVRYISQTDGMAVLSSIGEWRVHELRADPLGVRLWGAAGEIGRGGVGIGSALSPIVRGLRRSEAIQRRVVFKRVSSHGGLVSGVAGRVAADYIDGFFDDRKREGWPVGELAQAFYHCERVGQWAASGLRRTIAGADQYTPFATRDFVEYSFSVSAAERFLESPHYRLLTALQPMLRDMPFERPWRRQHRSAAVALGLAELAKSGVRRQLRPRKVAPPPTTPPNHFGLRWIEEGMVQHRELIAAHPDSPLWKYTDRDRVHRLVTGAPEGRRAHLEGLGRVLTTFWYLHGPRQAPLRAGAGA